MARPKFTVKGQGGFAMKSWRDVGRLGYGNGGGADTPWTRQGIFIQSSQGIANSNDVQRTGGPGLPLSRRKVNENPNQKKTHRFLQNGLGLCMKCFMLPEGHDRLMEKLKHAKRA